jgi:hypothetical protein
MMARACMGGTLQTCPTCVPARHSNALMIATPDKVELQLRLAQIVACCPQILQAQQRTAPHRTRFDARSWVWRGHGYFRVRRCKNPCGSQHKHNCAGEQMVTFFRQRSVLQLGLAQQANARIDLTRRSMDMAVRAPGYWTCMSINKPDLPRSMSRRPPSREMPK